MKSMRGTVTRHKAQNKEGIKQVNNTGAQITRVSMAAIITTLFIFGGFYIVSNSSD
jgi:hypothetical protein